MTVMAIKEWCVVTLNKSEQVGMSAYFSKLHDVIEREVRIVGIPTSCSECRGFECWLGDRLF